MGGDYYLTVMIRACLQCLVFAATLLTISNGSLSILYGTDGPLVILCAETAEDIEQGQRDDLFARVSEPLVETTNLVSTLPVPSTYIDSPIVRGPQNERGPPVVEL